MRRFRILLILGVLTVSIPLFAQDTLDLTPKNMIKLVGKVDKSSFEQIVGSPVGYENDRVVYDVTSAYDGNITAIGCYYRESDGKLISVQFITRYYLGYWIGFVLLDGFPKTEEEAERLGMVTYRKDKFGEINQVHLKLKSFGCQILNIEEKSYYTTAVINYHIVK